jgi:hypothetical protein
MTYAKTTELPAPVQTALKAVGYGRADIEVSTSHTVELSSSGSTGRRAFVILVNLTTGETRTVWGSWGGPNMFNKDNPVDLDNHSYPLPPNGVALKGSVGGVGGVFATVHIPASMTDRMLPGPSITLTEEEKGALYCFKAIRGGKYRQDEMRRIGVQPETVDSLVERGLLKRNRAGATAITTEGKNAYENRER